MKTEQIRVIHELAEQNVITLNGIKANVHPSEGGVLIENNPYQDDESWDETIVDYPTFVQTVRNNDGIFRC